MTDQEKNWYRTLGCLSIVLRWQIDQILDFIKNKNLSSTTDKDQELLELIESILEHPTPLSTTELCIVSLNLSQNGEAVMKNLDKLHQKLRNSISQLMADDLTPEQKDIS